MTKPAFSHVPYATDYMKIAVEQIKLHFREMNYGELNSLDIPAGNGWIADQLRSIGISATAADINQERLEFIQADMEQKLPFPDQHFDIVTCCEGIEHVFSPFNLFSELNRVLKPGGILVITTPNTQNLYSRIQFLLTGYPFQFDPFDKTTLNSGTLGDKGHISPVLLIQLIYWSQHFGLTPLSPMGGRYKKRWLIVVLLPLIALGTLWALNDWKKTSGKYDRKFILAQLFNINTLLSRSLIFRAVKPQ